MNKYKSIRKRKEAHYYIYGIFSILASIVIAGVVGYMKFTAASINKINLCPSTGPLGHNVLLIDTTDPLNFTQKQAFTVMVRDIIENRTPEGYLLSVFSLGEDFKENAEPLIELCNPGSGAGKSAMTSNLERLRKQYEERFLSPIQNEAENLVSGEAAKYSPIFEMLQLVGINAFKKNNVKGDKRLFIFSDMLHNTPEFSMFRSPSQYSFEKHDETSYGRKTYIDLSEIKVELYYLLHTPKLQTRRNLNFWEEYFKKSGTKIVAVKPLEG